MLDIDLALHEDPIYLLMLYTLALDYQTDLVEAGKFREGVQKLCKYVGATTEGMNYYMEHFNYEKSIDFVRLL